MLIVCFKFAVILKLRTGISLPYDWFWRTSHKFKHNENWPRSSSGEKARLLWHRINLPIRLPSDVTHAHYASIFHISGVLQNKMDCAMHEVLWIIQDSPLWRSNYITALRNHHTYPVLPMTVYWGYPNLLPSCIKIL